MRIIKKQGMLILYVMTFMAFLLFTIGCQKSSEEMAEKMIESATGGNVELDTSNDSISIKTDEGTWNIGGEKEWPDAIPSYIPKFSEGEIVSVMETSIENGMNVSVGIKQANLKDLNKYRGEFQGADWDITSSHINDEIYIFTAAKDKDLIIASFGEDKGSFSGTITYSQEK